MTQSNIEIKNLSLSLGSLKIIDKIDLKISKGEIIAILGPSGCGKTSFLNALCGVSHFASGKIMLNGKEVLNRTQWCSYMLQEDLLFPWRNILNNVLITTELVDNNAIEYLKYQAIQLLDDFGLKEFMYKYPDQLSGGMRRRAAFVRTLLNVERALYLFDEPTSGLDYLLRLQLEEKLFHFLIKHQKSAILITHDIETAIAVADRVIILAPRPTFISEEYQVGLARLLSSTSKTREHPDFQKHFNCILNSYKNIANGK